MKCSTMYIINLGWNQIMRGSRGGGGGWGSGSPLSLENHVTIGPLAKRHWNGVSLEGR